MEKLFSGIIKIKEMITLFSNIKEIIFDTLFPKFCENCGREGTYLCEDCFYLIDIFETCYCPYCQIPKATKDGETCKSCKRKRYLDGLFSAASYQNPIIKKMIIDFKYGFVKDISQSLSFLIIAHLIKLDRLLKFKNYIIIPVPLSNKKLRQRGFNQSEIIAEDLVSILKSPINTKTLIKIKHTKNQADLEKLERGTNLKSAFLVKNPETIANQNILLIDDVMTTGATLEECAKTLKLAGAKKVWAIVIARA